METKQLNMFDDEGGKDDVINKLLLLYLIDKMDMPLTNSQISQFILEESFMTYYVLQQTLSEMVADGYLEKALDNNATRYNITQEGITTLEYFEKHLSIEDRAKIVKFVSSNRRTIKKDFETTANYFYDHVNDEFTVKCGIYEDDRTLMEINVSVVNREQAKLICNNWKQNVSLMYQNILMKLISVESESNEHDEPDKK